LESLSDNALMLKVKEGDLDKLGLLFERYHRILFAFFYRMGNDKDLSEDLVQTVFIRIIKYKEAFKGQGEFKTWMFHIARNVNHDHYRKNKRLGNKESISNWDERLTDHETLKEQSQKEEDIKLLNLALSRLSEEKREIITLSKLKNIKYAEIGEILNCSEGAVKVKVFRALNDLRTIYKETKMSHG